MNEKPRGRGTWKFYNSFLKDDDFIKLIKAEIDNFKLAHAATPYNMEFVLPKAANIEFMTEPVLFWESLMAFLRGKIISYAIEKGKERKRKSSGIENKIKTLDLKISTGIATTHEFALLKDLNYQLIELRQEKLKKVPSYAQGQNGM